MLPRTHWQRQIARLDPDRDYELIYRIMTTLEFPWDMNQSLSFALFRTYAVPSIGRLLDETGEFRRDTQKRYDDTALLLDEPLREGLHSAAGRQAVRRLNRIHAAHDISGEDMRYVLATLVVIPKRWMDDYGWRPFSAAEVSASVRYYRELARLMGIRDVPGSYAAFEALADDYEAAHFGFDAGGRRVADSTIALLASFYPRPLRGSVDVLSRALLDEPLLEAFQWRAPPRPVVAAARTAMRLRARAEAVLPARSTPVFFRDSRRMRSYPDGYDIAALGPCPVSPGGPVSPESPASPASR